MAQVGESSIPKGTSADKWAEWRKLVFYDLPSAIRAMASLVKVLIIVAVVFTLLRTTFWSVVQATKPLADALRGTAWPQVTVIVCFVVGVVAVLGGISFCIYRYIDTR